MNNSFLIVNYYKKIVCTIKAHLFKVMHNKKLVVHINSLFKLIVYSKLPSTTICFCRKSLYKLVFYSKLQ